MNREIKFRGVRRVLGDVIYGYLVEWFSENERRFAIDESNDFDSEDNSLNVFEVLPETIGQFIGQLDVNNTERCKTLTFV